MGAGGKVAAGEAKIEIRLKTGHEVKEQWQDIDAVSTEDFFDFITCCVQLKGMLECSPGYLIILVMLVTFLLVLPEFK